MKKILMIDDANLHLKSYEKFVTQSDIADKVQLLLASSGEEGVSIYIDENIDLIFSDIEMPTLSGYDVCLAIKESEKHQSNPIPIVMLSSQDEMADKIKAFICGADDYIKKPFDRNVLINVIKQHLNIN